MFSYTNNTGRTFEKNRQNMIYFLQSGAGQTLSGMKKKEEWTIKVISCEKEIIVNLVNKTTGEIADTATAILICERRCNGCGEKFKDGETRHYSSVFGANDIYLCQYCWEFEETQIRDTNDQPQLLAWYKENQ